MLALFLLLVAPGAGARADGGLPCETAPLSAEADFFIDLGPFACVLADADGGLTLADALSPAVTARFAPVPGGLVDFGFGSARYWVRARVRNVSDRAGRWFVTHDQPLTDEIAVHLVREDGGGGLLLSLGPASPFGARPVPYRNLATEIALEAGEEAEIVLAYRTGQATQMPLFAEGPARFMARLGDENALIVAMLALVLGMGLISTIYLVGLRGPTGLVYGAYVGLSVLMLAHLEGYGFQYLWPGAPGWNRHALPFLGFGVIAFGALFTDLFTEARQHHRRLHRLLLATVAVLVVLAALSVPFLAAAWYKVAGLLAAAAGAVLQVGVAAAATRRGQPGAPMLLAGFGLLTLTLCFTVLGYLTEGLFDQSLAGHAGRLGFVLEAFAFSAAIALRVREARRERDAYLARQLRLASEKLQLSEALRVAEDDRRVAAAEARQSRAALASAAHDIRQPLASLRMALMRLGGRDAATRAHIGESFDYLDGIVRESLDGAPLGSGEADPAPEGAAERFAAALVLDNVERMFAAEAARAGIALRCVRSSRPVRADPLAVMRAVSNLTANALRHAGARRVLIGCRAAGPRVRFEVHDDGCGMSADVLAAALRRGERGPDSQGDGLGLAIVGELAARRGLGFDIASAPGRGTAARLAVPAG